MQQQETLAVFTNGYTSFAELASGIKGSQETLAAFTNNTIPFTELAKGIKEQQETSAALANSYNSFAELVKNIKGQQETFAALANSITPITNFASNMIQQQKTLAALANTSLTNLVQSAEPYLGEEIQKMVGITANMLEARTAAEKIMKSSLQIDMSFVHLMNDWSSQGVLQLDQQLYQTSQQWTVPLLETTNQLLGQYSQLMESWPTMPHIDVHTSLLMDWPALETWQHIQCAEVMTHPTTSLEQKPPQLLTQLEKGNAIELEQWLAQKHPSLCSMWRGARQAFLSNNPDRVRQVMISLRTLLEQLLPMLAPDAEVRAWSSDPHYYEGKKILRKGQLYYICRHINNSTFSKFVDANINAVLSLAASLNQIHELENGVTEKQFCMLLNRFESALLFLREVQMS
jgi:Predicted pPIWI-associating nuclease